MAIEAKTTFLRSLEQQLSTQISVADMAKVLSAVADQLPYYKVEQLDTEANANDDLLDAYTAAMQIQGRSPKTMFIRTNFGAPWQRT